MLQVTEEMMEENRCHIAAGHPTRLAGDSWGIGKLSNMVKLPNRKTDGNNQHAAFISTDLPEENWPWPTSSWEWRDRFAQRRKDYTLGLFWFAQNNSELPEHFRKAMLEWGLAKDEYPGYNGNFPRQVYVREGRRFEGVYFFTAKDALPTAPGKRPPLHAHSVTSSHYALDSHAARKRETGRAHLDGFVSYPTAVYTVPLGVMLPRDVKEPADRRFPYPVRTSVFAPCAWSLAGWRWGRRRALRLRWPSTAKCQCRMTLYRLQDLLIGQKATLVYYRDVRPDDTHFRLVQYMGLRGYLPEWNADLQGTVDEETLHCWSALCGFSLQSHSRQDITAGSAEHGFMSTL